MRNRRRPSKTPLTDRFKVNKEIFDKLPDHLKKAIRSALGGSEEISSSLLKPPGVPVVEKTQGREPPVLFFNFKDYLGRCSMKTLVEMVEDRGRWYRLNGEQREQIRARLGWSYEAIHRLQDGEIRVQWHGTLEEWVASFAARTDPPEPGGTRTSS
jgi:hypothetical protein